MELEVQITLNIDVSLSMMSLWDGLLFSGLDHSKRIGSLGSRDSTFVDGRFTRVKNIIVQSDYEGGFHR